MIAKIRKIMCGVVFCLAMTCLYNYSVFAANATVSVSSQEVAQGETVTVTITLNADAQMGTAQIYLKYDSDIITYTGGEFEGGTGILKYTTGDFDETALNKSITASFTAKTVGTANLVLTDDTAIGMLYPDGTGNEAMNITHQNGTVKVNAPTSASADCKLSALSVSAIKADGSAEDVALSPTFAPDTFEYTCSVSDDVAKLTVSTAQSDSKATTKISGTRMDPGDNVTTVLVTAENGATNTYRIFTTKGTSTAEQTTAAGEEVTTVAPESVDRTAKEVTSLGKFIIQDTALITVPEGFEEATASYEGTSVIAFKGVTKKLTLLALADDAMGTNVTLYIYDETSGNLSKMINITDTQKIYTVIPADESVATPDGYKKTEIEINGEKVTAWMKNEGAEFFLVYAMNYNGETGFYIFDTVEQTMQRYKAGDNDSSLAQTNNGDLQNQYDTLEKKYNNEKDKKNIIIYGLAIVCFFLVIGCILLLFKVNIIKEDDDEEDNDDNKNILGQSDGGKELKLDMVAQVNETKPAKLAAEVSEMLDEPKSEGDDGKETENEKEVVEDNKEKTKEDDEHLINMEDDEPFEIEFVDLEDSDKKSK